MFTEIRNSGGPPGYRATPSTLSGQPSSTCPWRSRRSSKGRDIPTTSRPEAVTSLSSPSLTRWDQGQPPQNPRHWPSGAAAPRCGKWYAIALVTTCNKKQDSTAPSWPRIGVRSSRCSATKPGLCTSTLPTYISKRCSHCGQVDRASRRNQSAFHCTSCGYWANGDLNVAQTILASGVGATARGEAFSAETSTIHP